MEYRFATSDDLDRLAEWNQQLICDEGHRNRMTVPELRDRMEGWLASEYKAVLFGSPSDPVAYALFRESATEIHLRHLFVRRDRRSAGIGREAVGILRERVWPLQKRLTVEVLTANDRAVKFWRSVGYKDYCLALEIMPENGGEPEGPGHGSQAPQT
jgi:GNAT superfamily N-acetyltransferase